MKTYIGRVNGGMTMLMRRVIMTAQSQTWAAHAQGIGDGYVTFFHGKSCGTFRVKGTENLYRFEFTE
jgi:hypothetical protein